MFARWPIRRKLFLGLFLLFVIVGTLSYSGFHGVYAYRNMVKGLSSRVSELPAAAELSHQVSNLRVALRDLKHEQVDATPEKHQQNYCVAFNRVKESLDTYRQELLSYDEANVALSRQHKEWQTVNKIESTLQRIQESKVDFAWSQDPVAFREIRSELDDLQVIVAELPTHLFRNIQSFRAEVRNQYRTLIVLVWVTSFSAVLFLAVFVYFCYRWVFRPLRVLIKGSRLVAQGKFNVRIRLETDDEMSELAQAMNNMTEQFCSIRDDLDQQVRERTKQVVRSEKLASVGFLAAGVAHEINNPLASIAMCAESLESRVAEILSEEHKDRELFSHYLRIIQSEAFRCKGITGKLRDFSRMGEQERDRTDLQALVQEMIDLLAHHGEYRDKQIVLTTTDSLHAPVNSQEIKQVVLNLLVNALDSLDPGGKVEIAIRKVKGYAQLDFTDNGCGMNSEVLDQLFEPFFTRRRDGSGTGLGLSITYRIIEDHQGHIEANSQGIGHGSHFRVQLPLEISTHQQESPRHEYAA